jgi:hypothetical protein
VYGKSLVYVVGKLSSRVDNCQSEICLSDDLQQSIFPRAWKTDVELHLTELARKQHERGQGQIQLGEEGPGVDVAAYGKTLRMLYRSMVQFQCMLPTL